MNINTSPSPYAELQTTTNFSFLEGGSHPEELVKRGKALGLSAIAITDRNTLGGVVRAHVTAKEQNMRLIIGARLDLEDAASLLVYPTDRNAYGRLSKLLTLGKRRAEKGACTLYLNDVAEHAEGQIFIILAPYDFAPSIHTPPTPEQSATTAKIIQFPSPLKNGHTYKNTPSEKTNNATSFTDQITRIKDALNAPTYLGLTHTYRGDDLARMTALRELSWATATPLIATGNILYHDKSRRPLQDVLTSIREKCTIENAGFHLDANAERHLKSPNEMHRIFADFEDALDRTIDVLKVCRFSLDELVYEYPDEPVPKGKKPQTHLEDLTWAGAKWRYPEGVPDHITAILTRELGLIKKLRYAPYFLTVHDITSFARSQDILCQGRGSAANSAVCYCLGLTNVNPAEIDLLFDRFISEERKEPPDIDVDFEHERREEVIQYIYRRYGRDRAGLAATVISYRARSSVRDVGKAMGLSEDIITALTGLVWGGRSKFEMPTKRIIEAGLNPDDPLLRRTLELTHELIGFPRHLSQHVGGFVLTKGPLSEVVPIGNAAMNERTCIEWDKNDLSALGLLKVDVLALGMLTCIHRCFDLIEDFHGGKYTLATVPREDPKVYDMLCKADSIGVFQVESRAQMNMLPRLKPRIFYDLVIEVAIVRPGPIQGNMVHPYLRRRDGLEREEYPAPHPDNGPADELRQILGKTKGVPLFQEQAMRIAMTAAHFSSAEANELRRAMATFRRHGTIGKLEKKMVGRMVGRGYTKDFATRCFNQIKGFGDYGFPESHAASFAHLVYISSWLKCHHPAVFAAGLLNSQPMGFYAPAQIVGDAVNHGVDARPSDINMSDWDCTLEHPQENCMRVASHFSGSSDLVTMRRDKKVEQNDKGAGTSHAKRAPALRLGLRLIDGLRKAEAEKLMAAREKQGPHTPFTSIHDLWRRAGLEHATLQKLASADAFRSIGLDRRQALWEVRAISKAQREKGQISLFDWTGTPETGHEPEVKLPEMPLAQHVINDYQTTRLSLKAHPMSFLRATFEREKIITCAALENMRDGAPVEAGGIILIRQRPGSAKGVVFLTIEDETGTANIVIWPKVMKAYRKEIMGARIILIKGRIQRTKEIIHIVAQKLEDRSHWLELLSEEMQLTLKDREDMTEQMTDANKDGLKAPENPRPIDTYPRRHPRDVRIIPKSRDFH